MSEPKPFRCSTCNSTSGDARNLAVFIDGTSNAPGPMKTNVFKLYDIIPDGRGSYPEQYKLYLEGIGAEDPVDPSYTGKVVYNVLDQITARNVEKNVKNAYDWLVAHFQKGDQIYLFGFSRGAYQVRALASMIHEVGLLKKGQNRTEQAYRHYLSIDLKNPKTSESAVNFKRSFCELGVRIHFIGVWDTVSSLGLIKQDVHITSSASVTNACHFRHALALDELRVKFMPEYFVEANAHHSKVQSPRQPVSDVKEVWFAGCHSDVGGISRPHTGVIPKLPIDEDSISPVHAGNVPLVWMGREANAEGLAFESIGFHRHPEDVDRGREDAMGWWSILEVMPFRHQVSFSGTGRHETRTHWFQPRLVIPGQQIHYSVFPGNVYTTRATLAYGVEIPMVKQEVTSGGLWTTEYMHETTAKRALESLLCNRQKTLNSLGDVLFLLNLRLEKLPAEAILPPPWLKATKHEEFGLDECALTIIYDVICYYAGPEHVMVSSDYSTSEGTLESVKDSLSKILRSSDTIYLLRALYILSFAAGHRKLRERFISNIVIEALVFVLERFAKSTENIFQLVAESLRYLIDDARPLSIISSPTELEPAKQDSHWHWMRRGNVPSHSVALLKMIVSIAQHQRDRCEVLRTVISSLAAKRSPAGSTAVEVLVKLGNGPYNNIRFSNILGYLANSLPRLDVEIGNLASPGNIDDLLPVLKVNGSGELDKNIMRNIVSAAASPKAHRRTVATLTLLKLCNNSSIRKFCSDNKVLDHFLKQTKRKETSLLAAYGLKTCLDHNMLKSEDLPRVANTIVGMVDKCWFDDAVGRVEGAEIFRALMKSGDGVLKQKVIDCGIVAKLEKKLEAGDHHETRMSLICLDILWENDTAHSELIVTSRLNLLKSLDARKQTMAIKILSSMAQTEAGEKAIRSNLAKIIEMLHPSHNGVVPSRQQLFAAASLLYALCKNETLRKEIYQSSEFAKFKRLRQDMLDVCASNMYTVR